MKSRTSNIGWIALAAGIVAIPLIRYWQLYKRKNADGSVAFNPAPSLNKGLFRAYRGRQLPHRRNHGSHNGYPGHN